MTAVSLADVAGVSAATISQYENGHHKPRQETLDSLARALNVPSDFLLRPINQVPPTRLFYRSMSSATKGARARAEARYEWFLEALDYVLDFFDFPTANLPEINVPADFHDITEELIESWAQATREFWGLGSGPIANVVQTLEKNGVIVWRTSINAETLDAFSEWRQPHPVVVLSSEKNNYFRSRTDAAHELAHLVMHRNVDRRALTRTADFKIIEKQAHFFAGAFLLPKEFQADVWGLSLDAFRSLKPRWNATIGLQIHRCRDLRLLTEDQEKRLWINRSRRGWHRLEPLDASTPPEQPNLMADSFRMLIESRVKSPEQIVKDLILPAADIESIAGLSHGLISGASLGNEPRFRDNSNVVPFRR